VISTNGNVANSPSQIERLVAAGPDMMIVCVDGADQQTYQIYRVGRHLKMVLQTIRRLSEARDRLRRSYPLIEFRSLATKHTELRMPELLRLAQESGTAPFTVKTLRPYNYRGYDVDRILAPESVKLSRYRYEGNKR
jgi:MoaA/NifB/PqqE/SkfB family radical SAM enzyme